MSKAAMSVFLFSIYMFVLGAVLLIAPNALLLLFGLSETSEVWIRVVGMLVVILGFYYATAARNELTPFLRATVYGRISVLVCFTAFVFFGFAPPVLILFGLIDAFAAGWTTPFTEQRCDSPHLARLRSTMATSRWWQTLDPRLP